MARQMAEVRTRTRPWRAIIALVFAAAAGIVASLAGRGFEYWTGHGQVGSQIAQPWPRSCSACSRSSPAWAWRASAPGPPASGRLCSCGRGPLLDRPGRAILTLVIGLALFKIPVGQLIVGGALTTILIGIAAQQSLSNIFAGLVLLLSRPFNVGEAIQLRSGALGGVIDGMVTEIGITYMRLDTADGPMSLPNGQVLAAAVSRRVQVSRPYSAARGRRWLAASPCHTR